MFRLLLRDWLLQFLPRRQVQTHQFSMPKNRLKNQRPFPRQVSDETFGTVYTAKLSILTIPVCERRCLCLLDFVLEAQTLDYVPRYLNALLDEHTVFGKSPKVIRSVEGFVFVAGRGEQRVFQEEPILLYIALILSL